MKRLLPLACTLLVLSIALAGCQNKVTQGPKPLPEVAVGVAQFTQPTQVWELLAGYVPDNQKIVKQEVLSDLNRAFTTVLTNETKRTYVGFGSSARCEEIVTAKLPPAQTNALMYWTEVGRCMKVDMLIVPQLIDWQERTGGEMGTNVPASVKMDFYLVDTKGPRVVSRSLFEETQQSLSQNILAFDKWAKRKGKWITAQELAKEGMNIAVKELGL